MRNFGVREHLEQEFSSWCAPQCPPKPAKSADLQPWFSHTCKKCRVQRKRFFEHFNQGWPSVSVFCRPDIGFLSVSGIGRYRVKIFGKIPDSCLISAQTYDVIKDEIKIGSLLKTHPRSIKKFLSPLFLI